MNSANSKTVAGPAWVPNPAAFLLLPLSLLTLASMKNTLLASHILGQISLQSEFAESALLFTCSDLTAA